MPCCRLSCVSVLVQACLLASLFVPGPAELLEIPHHGHHQRHREPSHHELRHHQHHRAEASPPQREASSSVADSQEAAVATKVSTEDGKWHDVDDSDETAKGRSSAGIPDVPDDGKWHDVVDSDREGEATKVSLDDPSPIAESFVMERDLSSLDTTTQPPAKELAGQGTTSTTLGLIGGFHVPKQAWVQEQATARHHSPDHHHNHRHHRHHAERHGLTTSLAPAPLAVNDKSKSGGTSDAAVDEHSISNPGAKRIQMDLLAKLQHDKQVSHHHKHHKHHEQKEHRQPAQAPLVRSEVLADGSTL